MESKLFKSILASSKEISESMTLKEFITTLKSGKNITDINVGNVTRYGKFAITYKENGNAKSISIKCPLLNEGDKVPLSITLTEDKFKKGNFVAF